MTRLDALVLNRAEASKLTGVDDGVAALSGSLLTKAATAICPYSGQ